MIPLNPEPTEPAEATEPPEAGSPVAPSASMPAMETDAQAVIETLQGEDWVYLQALAEEQYSAEESATPGTLTYTVNVTNDQPTFLNYGWCTTTEEILQQNFEHIKVKLYFNGEQLGPDVVHPITFSTRDNMVCLSLGVLLSDWPAGEYQLETVATFDETINDGIADYKPGDYIHVYHVTVK